MEAKLVIELPWPDHGLSPNARLYWARRSRLVKKHRLIGRDAAIHAMPCRLSIANEGRIFYEIQYAPPDRRARDEDNFEASLNSYRDGIADALQVNDRRFSRAGVLDKLDPVKGGRVWLMFTIPLKQE